MAIKAKQMLCPANKKSIKFPHTMTPTRIVVHNTANDASAVQEITYMNNNNKQTSFHFAIDDKEVVQGLPLNVNGWHAGDGGKGKGNREGIGIEICYSKSGGDRFIAAEKLAAKFIAQLLYERNWGMEKVTKHQDYSGKYCPHRTLDMGWSRFLNMVKAELDALKKPVVKPTTTIKEIYRIRKTWKDASSQIGAYQSLTNAKKNCKAGYYVFDSKGKVVYPIATTTTTTTTTATTTKADNFLPARGYFKKGDKSANVGKIASFMYKAFPSYTSKKALGNLYGDNLIKAVKEFQRRTGLNPDGYFGKLTLAELEKYGFKK